MKTSISLIASCACILSLLVGCNENEKAQKSVDLECPEVNSATSNSHNIAPRILERANEVTELYLSQGQQFSLEEKSYTFNDIYLETGSNIVLSGGDNNQDSIIELKSLGSCDFHGDISLSGYVGTLIIDCYGSLNLSGKVSSSNGLIILKASSLEIPGQITVGDSSFDGIGFGSVTLGDASAEPSLVSIESISIDSSSATIFISNENLSDSEITLSELIVLSTRPIGGDSTSCTQ